MLSLPPMSMVELLIYQKPEYVLPLKNGQIIKKITDSVYRMK